MERGCIVLARTTVVGAGGDGDHLVGGILLDGVLWVLVGPDDHADMVGGQELLYHVLAVHHDVALLVGVSQGVGVHACHVIIWAWVTPEKIHSHLLCCVIDVSKSNLEWPLDLLNILNLVDTVSNASMDTHDLVAALFVIDDGSQGHVLKHIVEFVEHAAWLVDLFIEPGGALLTKSEVSVHVSVFVVTSQQEDLSGVFQLESKEQADDL